MLFYVKLKKRQLIPLKMDYSCCFSILGNLNFLDFLQKKFLTLTLGKILNPPSCFFYFSIELLH